MSSHITRADKRINLIWKSYSKRVFFLCKRFGHGAITCIERRVKQLLEKLQTKLNLNQIPCDFTICLLYWLICGP